MWRLAGGIFPKYSIVSVRVYELAAEVGIEAQSLMVPDREGRFRKNVGAEELSTPIRGSGLDQGLPPSWSRAGQNNPSVCQFSWHGGASAFT